MEDSEERSFFYKNILSACKKNPMVDMGRTDLSLMHKRLGDTSLSKMKHLAICDCKEVNEYFCDTCSVEKHHKIPFYSSHSIGDGIFDLIHIDLWGPYRTQAVTGANFFFTILDDHSRVTWIYLLSNKHQIKHTFTCFIAYVSNHFNYSVKTVRSDNGTELFQSEYSILMAEKESSIKEV